MSLRHISAVTDVDDDVDEMVYYYAALYAYTHLASYSHGLHVYILLEYSIRLLRCSCIIDSAERWRILCRLSGGRQFSV